MINNKTNNLILLIRLFLFFTIVLVNLISGFNSGASSPFSLDFFIIITIFSLIIFIGQNFISQTILFYVQGLFDLLMVSYFVKSTGFFDSPYIVFYSIIIIYMCFFEGIKAGLFSILGFIIIISYFTASVYLHTKSNIVNEYVARGFQYGLSFVIIMLLTSYLHKVYSIKNKEKADIEEKLKYIENLYKSILDNIDIGIILLSKNGIIISCNNAGNKILSVNGTIVGKKLTDILDVKSDDEIVKYNNKFIGYKLQPFYYDNLLSGELFIFQDVTEKENLRSQLHEQEKLAILGQFSTIIAHEIKNPLGAIKGSLQILKKNKIENLKLFNIVEREISRLDNTLNNLLMVVKDKRITNEVISLDIIVKDFVNELKYYELFEDINIVMELYGDDFRVNISAGEIKQVVWNLVLNSFQIKNNVNIFITITKTGDNVVMHYKDDGPGMNKEIKNMVFKPFFTTKKTGSGLGLYVIKIICDKYGIKADVFDNTETLGGFAIEFKFPLIS